ncbi:hypothetical protein [Nocardia sp. NPDC052566]
MPPSQLSFDRWRTGSARDIVPERCHQAAAAAVAPIMARDHGAPP